MNEFTSAEYFQKTLARVAIHKAIFGNSHLVIRTAKTVPLISFVDLKHPGEASVVATVSMKSLFGYQLPLEELREKIQDFDGNDLLLFATKLGLVLMRDDGALNTKFQLKIAKDLLPVKAELKYMNILAVRKIQDELNGREYFVRPLITPVHIVHFLREIIQYHRFTGTQVIHNELNPGSAEKAFELLLAFGEHVFGGTDHPFSTEEAMAELVRNALFLHRESTHHLLGRFYKLLFDLPARSCLDKKTQKSLAELFFEATGISLESFYSVGFAFLTRFCSATLLNYDGASNVDPNENCLLRWNEYLSKVKVSPDEMNKIREMFAVTVPDAAKEFREMIEEWKTKGSNLSESYNLLPLMRRPLLDLNGNIFLPTHYPFIGEKFTSGVFWLIFDSLSKKDSGSFRSYWGCLCQKYIEEIFSLQLIPRLNVRASDVFYDPPYKKQGTEASGTDIMLYDKKTKELFLFEVTFSALRVETTFRKDNLEPFSEGIEKMVGKCAQMNTVIQDIKSGALQLQQTRPEQIKRYVPIIVTMSPLPVWPFLWRTLGAFWKGFPDRLKERNLLQEQDIEQVRIISARDLEYLAAVQGKGSNPLQLLRAWSKSRRWSGDPLMNFLVTHKSFKPKFEFLDAALHKAGDLCKRNLFGDEDKQPPDSTIA